MSMSPLPSPLIVHCTSVLWGRARTCGTTLSGRHCPWAMAWRQNNDGGSCQRSCPAAVDLILGLHSHASGLKRITHHPPQGGAGRRPCPLVRDPPCPRQHCRIVVRQGQTPGCGRVNLCQRGLAVAPRIGMRCSTRPMANAATYKLSRLYGRRPTTGVMADSWSFGS